MSSSSSPVVITIPEDQAEHFGELRERMDLVSKQLEQSRMQYQMRERAKRAAALTLTEMESLSSENAVYRPLGQMFVRTTVPKLVTQLEEEFQRNDSLSKETQESLKRFEEQQNNLSEEMRSFLSGLPRK